MGFLNQAAYINSFYEGRTQFCSIRKVPSQTSVAGWWVDLSMAAGNPKPNYYASTPLVAAILDGIEGIFHGQSKSPSDMYLTHLGLMTPTAGLVGNYCLLDYLLYYPFIDGDESSEQAMTNGIALPRYSTGSGVQVIAINLAPTTGLGQFTFNYVNQNGEGKTSPIINCSTTAGNTASLVNTEPAIAGSSGPFLKLASGDTGVRSITSVTFSVLNGGLMALVLVKPLIATAIREINTMTERTFISQNQVLPKIEDGAYLNFIMNCAATVAAGSLVGYCNFAWSG